MTSASNSRIWITLFFFVAWVICLGFSLAQSDFIIAPGIASELMIYSLLAAFAAALSLPLSYSRLSVVHAIGIMALFSLPSEAVPLMALSLAIGGAIGGALQPVPLIQRQVSATRWTQSIVVSALVTMPYFLAGRFHLDILGGALPTQDGVAIGLVTTLYLLVYTSLALLQIEQAGGDFRLALRHDGLAWLLLVILPAPFAVIGASVILNDESLFSFVTVMVGAVLVIFGLFMLSVSQQRLRRQLAEMTIIEETTQALRSNLNRVDVLQTAYSQVAQLLHVNNLTVALLNESNHLTYPLVVRQGDVKLLGYDQHPRDHILIEKVMTTRATLRLAENLGERLRSLGTPELESYLQSWLGVPVLVGDEMRGVFAVFSQDGRLLTEDDTRLLQIMVGNLAMAVENARLYEQKSQRVEQLATLNQIAGLLNGTLAISEVLEMIVSSASTISEANAVAIYLLDEDDNMLHLARSAGLSEQFSAHPPRPLLSEQLHSHDLYLKPQPLRIERRDAVPATSPHTRQTLVREQKHAMLESPLVTSNGAHGVLVLYFDDPQHFYDEQTEMIQSFAIQATQAIENAHAFATIDRDLDQRAEQLFALSAMGRMLNATLSPERIYETVLNYAVETTQADRAAIVLRSGEKRLTVPAQHNYPQGTFDDPTLLLQGLPGRAFSTGQALRTTDTRGETGYLPLVAQTRSILIAPLLKRQEVLGLIMLEHDRPSAFSESDAHFVMQIANQAVIAVDNTLLFHAIREARDKMQTILNATDEGIILIDEGGSVALANPRVELLGLDANDLLNQPLADLLNNEQIELAQRMGFGSNERLRRLLHEINDPDQWQPSPPHVYEVPQPDMGVRYIERQIIPVRDEHDTLIGALLIFRDETEERELAQQRESLSQMIVHDLRSPLTSVTTSLRLLQQLVPADSNFRPVVEKTTEASRRAIRKVLSRVDALLDISKMESGELYLEREPASLQQLVQSVQTELTPLAEEMEVTLVVDAPEDLPRAYIDSDKVERMILNLVDNALKYSPAQQDVHIGITRLNENQLQLAVADRGPGVPDDYKQRLFDRFVQVAGRKNVRRGVGLGLAFCKLVADTHGGRIWVEDNPAGGSIFKTTLPIYQPRPETTED